MFTTKLPPNRFKRRCGRSGLVNLLSYALYNLRYSALENWAFLICFEFLISNGTCFLLYFCSYFLYKNFDIKILSWMVRAYNFIHFIYSVDSSECCCLQITTNFNDPSLHNTKYTVQISRGVAIFSVQTQALHLTVAHSYHLDTDINPLSHKIEIIRFSLIVYEGPFKIHLAVGFL